MLAKLPLVHSYEAENRIIEQSICGQYDGGGQEVQILEAGCGQRWPLNLVSIPHRIIGVDMDSAALKIRKETFNDLSEIIVGNLLTVSLPSDAYDVIYCAYVLEHVAGAEQVMQNFVRWLKPKGLIVIRIPDPSSVQGYVTRITPHWFHVLYYRIVVGNSMAGKPGHAPYTVEYDPIVSRKGLAEFCKDNGLVILSEHGDGYFKPGKGLMKIAIEAFKRVMSVLSLGRLSGRHTNLLYVLQKV